MVSTNQMNWDAASRCFSAELSDLGRPRWSEAVVYGKLVPVLEVESENTKKVVPFYVSFTHFDDEGELQYYDLKVLPAIVRDNPTLDNVRMKLYND